MFARHKPPLFYIEDKGNIRYVKNIDRNRFVRSRYSGKRPKCHLQRRAHPHLCHL
jgi:hypothetical protein